jgi:hypothetical protein
MPRTSNHQQGVTRAFRPSESAGLARLEPSEKREPVLSVSTEPLALSARGDLGRRAHRTVSTRGHFVR